MNFAKRVVLDISTLISAVLRPDFTLRQALRTAVASATVCASLPTLTELDQVLMRDKFNRYIDQTTRREFLELYRRHARFFNVTAAEEAALPQPCRDPRNHKFLALAVYCVADALVKLRLHHDNSHPSHPRLRPNIAKPSSTF